MLLHFVVETSEQIGSSLQVIWLGSAGVGESSLMGEWMEKMYRSCRIVFTHEQEGSPAVCNNIVDLEDIK